MPSKELQSNSSEAFDRCVKTIIAREESRPGFANCRVYGGDSWYFRSVHEDEETGLTYIQTMWLDEELGNLTVKIFGNGVLKVEFGYIDQRGRDDTERFFDCSLDAIGTTEEGSVSIGDNVCSLRLQPLPFNEVLDNVKDYGLGIEVVSMHADWIIPVHREELVKFVNAGFENINFPQPNL